MYIPNDILNIIYDYKNQLELIGITNEIKKKVYYKYCSPFFSELSFENNIVSYYNSKDKLLYKIRNKDCKCNGIYIDSVIFILK